LYGDIMITGMPRIAVAVRDMDRAIATFRDVLGMPVYEFDWVRRSLGIRMSLCVPAGGSHIELMSPEDPARSHSASLIRFLERRGEGLFALMLYAPDPNAEAESLATRGLEAMPLMQDAGGRDFHPKNTHGVLIRIYPVGDGGRPRARARARPRTGQREPPTPRGHLPRDRRGPGPRRCGDGVP
jgi:catechol 2,3-dioxygenase-like lactoylglutathione lyase family enzyme